MKSSARKAAPRARRAPRAYAWAREVVGDLPRSPDGGPATEEQLTAYASRLVANACLKVRKEAGAEACLPLLENLILSAAHVAAGGAAQTPSKILRDLADALDEPLDPLVREHANA